MMTKVPLTVKGAELLRSELHQLKTMERPKVIAAIQEDGVCWCGGTTWQGREAMRIRVSSWATTDDDIERSLASILACARATAGKTAS